MNNILSNIMSMNNPYQYAYQTLQQMVGRNPMLKNALDSPEQFARNLAKEKGIDIDTLYNQIKNMGKF